jgi:hypothetical protein
MSPLFFYPKQKRLVAFRRPMLYPKVKYRVQFQIAQMPKVSQFCQNRLGFHQELKVFHFHRTFF